MPSALRRYLFVIFITLNILTFYGIMSVFITPDVAMASVLSGTFYGEHLRWLWIIV